MTDKRKRTPGELWDKLAREARLDDAREHAERLVKMTDAEVEAELRASGIDPGDLDGLLDESVSSSSHEPSAWVSSPPSAQPARSVPRRAVWLLAATLALALGAGLPFAAGLLQHKTPDVADAGPGPDAAPPVTVPTSPAPSFTVVHDQKTGDGKPPREPLPKP